MTEDETRDGRLKARKTLAQSGKEYADSYEVTSGALVTAYVAVYELTTAQGRYCLWLTGTGGEPSEDNLEGLDAWRVEGMMRKVLRDIYTNDVSDE